MLKRTFSDCVSERQCARALINTFQTLRRPLGKADINGFMYDDGRANGNALYGYKWDTAFTFLIKEGILRVVKGPTKKARNYILNMPEEEIELVLGKMSDGLKYKRSPRHKSRCVITQEATSPEGEAPVMDQSPKEIVDKIFEDAQARFGQTEECSGRLLRAIIDTKINDALATRIATLELQKYDIISQINKLYQEMQDYEKRQSR